MFTNGFGPWHILIIVLIVVLLFGAKRLPDAARSVGKSMKIFRAETRSMRDEEEKPAEEPETRHLPAARPEPDAGDKQVADLQRQLDELKKQQGAGDQAHKHAS
ncbi:MAG TPA: Sec-independent protein translocase subunit TatA [Amycolatopsis sp.]|nr:Sec-independent protein translocase subunit TatA [Amycolatopsis sp.]